jgi:hypothetical protein
MRIHPARTLMRLVCAVLACGVATPVAAQTSSQPDATPTATRRAAAQPPQTLIVGVSLFGGSSDAANESAAGIAVGTHADADAMLVYTRRVGRASFGLSGQSVLRHSHDELTPMRQQGGFDFSFTGGRQRFRASQSLGYTPYYQFGGITQVGLMPLSESAQSHGDLANANLDATTATTGVEWNRMFGERVSLAAMYDRRSTIFGDPALDMITQSAGARLSRKITRFAALRTGYAYRVGDIGSATAAEPLRQHDIDLGVDYSRPVSASGRTTVTFGSGSTLIPQDDGLAYRLTGDAALTRLIGRTWNARVGVNRSVQLLEGFAEPVLANIVNLALGGTLHRRVSLLSWGSMSTGTVGLTSAEGNGYANWSAGGGLSVMVGRRGSFDAQYFIAGDEFENGVVLPPGLSHQRRQRQGLRAGFSWRGPIVGR